MGLAEIQKEIESLVRRVKMKRTVLSDSVTKDVEIKKRLTAEIKELEQEMNILEKRAIKLHPANSSTITVPTQKITIKTKRIFNKEGL